MNSFTVLLCLILISISAILSGSEVAIFSLSRFQIRFLKDRFKTTHRKIKVLLADPGGLLITVLVVNEVVNVSLSSLISTYLSEVLRDHPLSVQLIAGLFVTTPIILFVCEITPKVIAARANTLIAPLTGGFLYAIYRALIPLRITIQTITDRVIGIFGSRFISTSVNEGSHPLKEEEFLIMVEEGHREGAIQESELELIKNVFDLDDTKVESIYTPLREVFSLNEKTTLKQAQVLFRGRDNSRIPITSSKKKIIGILHIKDLIQSRTQPELENQPVSFLMKKTLVVKPDLQLNALFRKFKQTRSHMAVVESSKGEAVGIVTMADVFDALFEELYEEEGA